ncbi:Chloroperoxidase [Coprinopsis sp. MPI-PUGE-AT-0042]|nr:Chloroperoxidase [Coprinopsis sp. MPI-PUGE-AT-0042]
MIAKNFFSLFAFLSLALTVQALPQTEASSAEDPARPPLQPVTEIPPPPPGPTFTGAKLVHDPAHPFMAPGPGDERGPCPGLNTLANHGNTARLMHDHIQYIPRNGVATPEQIIIGAQEGLNMAPGAARTAAYAGHILNGNLEYDLISIGGKTPLTGPDPPAPAQVRGLSQHGTFEGDASLTRADAFFGNTFAFNPELFEQFKNFSMIYGNGFFNHTVAGELRYHRIQESIANNPEFDMRGLRHINLYGEAAFVSEFFVDGRKTGAEAGQLDMVTAELFLKDNRFPVDFHRSAIPVAPAGAAQIFAAHPTDPGRNVNGVNTFEVDRSLGGRTDICGFYRGFINDKVRRQYPNPTGLLRTNLNKYLDFFYATGAFPFAALGCEQLFPYGQD